MKRLKQILTTAVHLRSILHTLLTLAVMLGLARAWDQTSEQAHLWILVAFIGIYLLFLLLLELLFRLFGSISKREMTELARPRAGAVNLDFIEALSSPVLVLDDKGKIVWFNEALSALSDGGKGLYGQELAFFAQVTMAEVADAGAQGKAIRLKERDFILRLIPIRTRNRASTAVVFEDQTELLRVRQEKEDETVLVAYIIIDNLEELSQYAQNRARSAATEVEVLLEHWASGFDGVLKEYEKEKFLMLFDRKHLFAMEESRFGILDRIREIRVGDSGLPLTVSIGISKVPGSPLERSVASAQCLEMALQRGGDQVVIRGEDGALEFYGGKTKTVQKRTRVRARMMALQLIEGISQASDVLIMMHRFPDFDAIGAALGMLRFCGFCGVEGKVIVSAADPNFARCYERVKHLPEFRDEKAFISPPQAQEAIGPETLLVIVDVNNRGQFELPELSDMFPGERTVYIDHHRKVAEFAEKPRIEYIEPSASSTCELITEMIEQTLQPGVLQKEVADIMYAGIALDTKQFVRNTGVRTFSAAVFLRGEGALPSDAQALFKTDLSDFRSEATFENNVTMYRETFAFAVREQMGEGPERIAAAKAADKLLTVEGIGASFAILPVTGGVFISARSQGEVNVQLIMEKLGGGGHFDAAATMIKEVDLDGAIERLKRAIDEQIGA